MSSSLIIYSLGSDTTRTAIPSGCKWLQFGSEMLLLGDETAFASSGAMARSGARRLPAPAKPANLYLVVQKGRLFQQEYPDAKVLLDKGRYLVVALTSTAFHRAKTQDRVCFSIRPLPTNQVVFDRVDARAARVQADPQITSLLGGLSQDDFNNHLTYLTGLPTRLSTSNHYVAAADWAQAQLAAWGYSVRTEEVAVEGGVSSNVIALRNGSGTGERQTILITAHLDSINQNLGPAGAAPGADDNGSGASGLLCLAKLFSTKSTQHDLQFILFGGEEQGLLGSQHHVASLTADERARMLAVINMDMIGSVNAEPQSVLLEGAPVSQALIDALATAAATYTPLVVHTSLDPHDSDHVPFIEAGMPGVLTIEGADGANHRIHTENDTLATITAAYALQILRMNAAAIASLAKLAAPPPAPTPPRKSSLKGASVGPVTPASEPGGVIIHLRPGEDLRDTLSRLGFKFSGRYHFNGGANLPTCEGILSRTRPNQAAINDPLYELDAPIYLDSRDVGETTREEGLRFSLHVDIDGETPLNVISGTVADGPIEPGSNPAHFIGKVTHDIPITGGRDLVVENFRFDWPLANNEITRLEARVSGSILETPFVDVTFIDTAADVRFGPYRVQQGSAFFRDAEVDVDREVGAVNVEPYSTVDHPDRPANVPSESLTLESAYAKAGIRLTRTSDNEADIVHPDGPDARWSYRELHDSMELHWQAFANRPQWKMWVFLANLGDSDGLGGVMFDGDIDEPGGVDRQGTAIFTKCPHFHTEQGEYILANPPVAEAVRRELFFNLIHETGHAFNLAHSFQKELGDSWSAPSWMPVTTNAQSLSWMNYPDSATPGGAGYNATWFYKRFRFRFDDPELLFLRHAPENFVQMGNAAWFSDHGRVREEEVDPRLTLRLEATKTVFEYGDPVVVELRLMNRSGRAVEVHDNLDLSDGFVEVAITHPDGERRPVIPISHTRSFVNQRVLKPQEKVFLPVDLTAGKMGFPFKKPGAYRLEASYTNLDGRKVAAVPVRIYVRPAQNWELLPQIHSLYHARVARLFYVRGSRVMDDTNDRLREVRQALPNQPLATYIDIVQAMPYTETMRVIDDQGKVRLYEENPEEVVKRLQPVVAEMNLERTANMLGNIRLNSVAQSFGTAALKGDSTEKRTARNALDNVLSLFAQRKIPDSYFAALKERARELM